MRWFIPFLLLSWACGEHKPDPVVLAPSETPPIVHNSDIIPVEESLDYDTSRWFEVQEKDVIQLELPYATNKNFIGEQLYECPRCFLSKAVQKPFEILVDKIDSAGYRLVIFDCYRPLSVQKKMWNIMPNPTYVTRPDKGSMHNRGLALDVGLADQKGRLLNMGSEFDTFSKKSHWSHLHTPDIQRHREVLKHACASAGFKSIRTEWWHFSYRNASAPVSDFVWSCKTSPKPVR